MDFNLVAMIFLVISGLLIIGIAVWYLNKPKQVPTLPKSSADGVPTISGKENPPTAGFKDGALYSQHRYQSFNDFAANSKGSFNYSGNPAGTVCPMGSSGTPPNCVNNAGANVGRGCPGSDGQKCISSGGTYDYQHCVCRNQANVGYAPRTSIAD